MTIYTAYFHTEADWASIEIETPTPDLALQHARRVESEEIWTLNSQNYDGGHGVEHIEILSADSDTGLITMARTATSTW